MTSRRLDEILLEAQVFSVVDPEKILTSGMSFTPFFVNTEKVLQDGGEWKEYANHAGDMVEHCYEQYERGGLFAELIDSMVEEMKPVLEASERKVAIAGGQRRDWPFAGVIAKKLGLDFIALYKSTEEHPDRVEVIGYSDSRVPDAFTVRDDDNMFEHVYGEVITIVDLITTASSIYSRDGDTETGWIPRLRTRGANAKRAYAVVSRCQGGEENLAEAGIEARTFVNIDRDFMTNNLSEATAQSIIDYLDDPRGWTVKYLETQKGRDNLVSYFDPQTGDGERALRFIKNYMGGPGVHMSDDAFSYVNYELEKRFGRDLRAELGHSS